VSFNRDNQTATVDPDWDTVPDDKTNYEICDGRIQRATSDTITLQGPVSGGDRMPPLYLKIVAGKGAGQDERTLTPISGNTYKVSPAWEKVPDATSYYHFYGTGFGGVKDPQGERGFWTWNDLLYQNAVWIDGRRKHGILFFTHLGVRHGFYHVSYLRSRGFGQYWFLFDPADLARVAKGETTQDEVAPKSWWENGYPTRPSLTNDPGDAYYISGANPVIAGATYDPVSKRLFLLCPDGYRQGNESKPVIFVYQVKD
jgi:hypothetical protein